MKHLKYILIVFILFLCPNVFASDINVNSSTSATRGGTKNKYSCLETYQYGSLNTCTFGTTYNGRMGQFEGFIYYPFEGQTNYTLTLNMASDDFRNNFKSAWYWDCEHNTSWSNQNTTVIMPTYVSYRKIRLNITPSENMTCVGVVIRSKNYPSDAFTGVNNWTLSNIILTDPTYSSGGGTSPTPTPSTGNQDIINNQNQNTQDIIDNNTQNTQDIIDNNNSNTQDIINNQTQNTIEEINQQRISNNQNCDNYISFNLSKGYAIDRNGTLVENSDSYYTKDFVPIPNLITQLSITNSTKDNVINNFLLVYNSSYQLIDYWYANNRVVSLPTGSAYFKLSSTQSTISVYAGNKGCINNVDSFLTDDSNPNIQDNDFMNMFNGVGVSDPLNYLLTLPTQLINKIVSLSGSCSPIELGSLYGTMLTLPCINIENIVGSSVWGIIDVIFSVSLLVVIFKNLYDTFSNLLTMGAEKEAKEKFSMPTPMDFLSMILGGDR